MGTCKFDALSTRYSTLPALISLTAFSTSKVTVPVFGFGINPFGPSTRPNLPTSPIISGVATITSNSNQHSLILQIRSPCPIYLEPPPLVFFLYHLLLNQIQLGFFQFH